MAQPGSALVWGTSGRWFKSSHPDQNKERIKMLKSKDSTTYFSFVIIPPSGRKSYTFRINNTIFKSIISLLMVAILGISILFYVGYDNTHTKSEFKKLKVETKKQNEKIKKLDSTLDYLQNHLQNIIER